MGLVFYCGKFSIISQEGSIKLHNARRMAGKILHSLTLTGWNNLRIKWLKGKRTQKITQYSMQNFCVDFQLFPNMPKTVDNFGIPL